MLSIRPATVEDSRLLRRLIRELAEYEKESDAVRITEAELARDGFGATPQFRAVIAEWDEKPAGYALSLATIQPGKVGPVSRRSICPA